MIMAGEVFQGFAILIFCSIIVQFIVDRVKPIISENYRKWAVPLVSLVMGILVAVGAQIGIFETIGILFHYKFLDYILTGVVFSGGSTAVNELIKLLIENRPSNKDDKK